MKKSEFEKYLGKNVIITLFDNDVIEGVLHKTEEKIFDNEPNLHFRPNYYVLLNNKTGKNTCLFRSSHVKKLTEIRRIQ